MRSPLLSPLWRWLEDQDPTYVEVARVAHIGLALALGIAAGIATNRGLGLDMPMAVPMFVALGATAHLSFLAPASRVRELVDLARISTLTLGFILLTAAIGPGSVAAGPVIMKLLLVPTTFVALYIRRFGPEYHRAGLALFITAMIAAVVEPTRAQGWWLVLAAVQGSAIAYLLRLAPLRPSAAGGLCRVLADYRRALVAVLTRLAEELRTETPITRALRQAVPRLRRRARAAALAAAAEQPQRRAVFEAVRATAYRLQLAVALLLEAAPDPGQRDAAAQEIRAQLAAAVAAVRDQIATGAGTPDDEVRAALSRPHELILTAPLADELQRYDLLRAVGALGRVLAATVELDAAVRPDAPVTEPPAEIVAGTTALSRPGLLPTTRVAIQGLVASAVTTALDLGFGLTHAYWATLTVMLVLGSSFGETVLRARHRTLGTCIGAMLGIAVAGLLGGEPWLLAALCILGQMLGALTAQRRYDISAAAIAFSVVAGLHLLGGMGARDMLARMYETGIGAGVALLAARFVLPVYGGDQARQQIRAILARCGAAFAGWWPREPGVAEPEPAIRLVRDLVLLEDRLPHLNAEAVFGRRSASKVVRLSTFLRVLQTYLLLVEHAAGRLANVATLGPAEQVLAGFRADVLSAFDVAGAGNTDRRSGTERALTRRAAEGMAELRRQGAPRAALLALVEYTFYGEALARALHALDDAVDGRLPADVLPLKA